MLQAAQCTIQHKLALNTHCHSSEPNKLTVDDKKYHSNNFMTSVAQLGSSSFECEMYSLILEINTKPATTEVV